MSKYDFEVDLSLDTSTGIILNKIKPKSTVLEFGCAAGRMTRYMKNALDCQVYIVEYDREAFDVAMQYAIDGVCDDILALSWFDKFKGIEFDSILFADVLEHLARPDIALCNAAKLLKEQGRIYISIPNIAHNDILLKAFDNHFDYTKIGLLDDTHVHFWGYENIVPFVEDSGLSVYGVEATYLSTGQTEQYRNTTIQCSPLLFNYFNERKFAEAYQFVIDIGKKCEKTNLEEKIDVNLKNNVIISHLYIDDGKGFNEKEIIAFESENTEPGRYVAHYVLHDVKGVKKLRFDPIEFQGCILQNLSFRQAGKELKCEFSEHLKLSEGMLMIGTDPMILADLISETDSVTIDADIIILGDRYLDMVKDACIGKSFENENLQKEINVLNMRNGSLQGEISVLNEQRERFIAQNENLQGEIDGLNAQKENLQAEIGGLNAQNESLNRQNRDLNEQNERLNGQNRDLNEQNERLNGQNRDLNEKIEGLNIQNKGLHDEINNLNSQVGNLQGEMSNLNRQSEEIQSRLGAYILLANKKDEALIKKEEALTKKDEALTKKEESLIEKDNYIEELEQQAKERNELSQNRAKHIIYLEHIIEEKDGLLNDRAEYITSLEQQVEYYKNRKCIKICDSFWRVYWSIRLKLRRLIRKETKDE